MGNAASIYGIHPPSIQCPGMAETDNFGARIKTLRIARGLSLGALGKILGVGAPAVFKWESGETQNMKNGTFIMLCEALGTDPQYLLWGADRKPPTNPGNDDNSATGTRRSLRNRG